MSTKKTILIVDDDPDYLFQIKTIVEKLGHNTITADSQKEAEKIIDNTRPDLAILDLMMESQDSGFILSYRIKKKYPDVPVIIASAVTAETGLNFGVDSNSDKNWIKADAFMDKGIREDQLNKEINRLLKI